MHASNAMSPPRREGIPLFWLVSRRRDDRSLILLAFLWNPPAPVRRLIGALVLGMAVVILPWMGATPALAPPGDGYSDKIMHVACFAGLGLFGFWAYRSRLARMVLLLSLLALGVGIELIQGMVPERQASTGDVLADATGLVLAIILLRQWPLARDMLFPDGVWKGRRRDD